MNALQTFNEILQHADLIASAILQQTNPKRDLISQRKAYQEYGADLIKRGEEAGMLKPIRNGKAKNSPILYSRKEIIAQIKTESIMRNDGYAILATLKE
jgi:hypothetical protein